MATNAVKNRLHGEEEQKKKPNLISPIVYRINFFLFLFKNIHIKPYKK